MEIIASYAGVFGLVFLLGQQGGKLNPVRLVLAGVVISYVFTSVTNFLQLQTEPNNMRQIMFWLLGSVSGAHWEQLHVAGVVVVASTLLLSLYGRQLNALSPATSRPQRWASTSSGCGCS